jgi:hypothetical protein
MIQPGQFGSLKLSANARFGDERHEPDAFDTACMFPWKTIEGVLELLQRAFRQRTLVLVFNAYGHKNPSL